jgi:hypothetical protein
LRRQDIGHGGGRALVGNDHHVDAGSDPKQLPGQMRQGPDRGAEVQPARIGARIGDELLQRVGGHARRDHQREGRARHERDWDEVLARIVTDVLRDQGAGCERGDTADQQGVAVGLGGGRGAGADRPAGAGPVVDDHLLSEHRRQPLRDQAAHHVDRPAGGERHDQLDRLGRIGLRARCAGGEEAQGDDRDGDDAQSQHLGPAVPRDDIRPRILPFRPPPESECERLARRPSPLRR